MIVVPTVRLSFTPTPAHVRTARLVGAAVARRAGVGEALLEEIRLAIGEACSRAVAVHRSGGLSDLVDVVMVDGDRFTVEVTDRAAQRRAAVGEAGDPTSLLAQTHLPFPVGALGEPADPTAPFDPASSLTDPASQLEAAPEALAEEAVAARMGLALLAGLVDDLEVSALAGGGGTRVRMSWPVELLDMSDHED